MQLEPLVLHIGKRKAAPECCPICGSTQYSEWYTSDFGAMLKVVYGSPIRIYQQPVGENWPGYKTWYYKCYHTNPFNYYLMQDSLLSTLSKSIGGRSFIFRF
jgi:hypothetical protein